MQAKVHQIRVEHCPTMYDVETVRHDEPQHLTLLELVKAVADVTDDEQEIIATVCHMLRTGSVRLIGNFRDEPIHRMVS